MNHVIRDSKVAVLFSPSYGAGWSYENQASPEIMFDPVIVDCVERQAFGELKKYMDKQYPDAYLGGMDGLCIEWIAVGTQFRINEYDGSESIEYATDTYWTTA